MRIHLMFIATVTLVSFVMSGEVITYPFPDGMPKYSDVEVVAGGKNIDLYSVRANNTHYWGGGADAASRCNQIPVAMFDFEGVINISVTLPVVPTNVVIRPASRNITPHVSERTVSFSISKAGQFSVEYNNDNKNAILIFANPIETFSGTQILEGGIIHTGNYTVNAGQTLYLKAGAVLRGKVVMNSGSKIVGRGIIDGSQIESWMNIIGWQATLPIETYGGNDIEIDGISIFDPNAWCVQLQNASNVTVNKLKIISSRANSDGISIQSSNNIRIKNSFVRSWDDGIVIKNYTDRNSYDIIAENCVLWTDLAQAMEIGVETNKGQASNPQIYDVTFNNIDVIHAMHKAPISIHNGDNARIHNIKFTNITVDNYQAGNGDGWNYLIDITNLTGTGMGGAAEWTTVTERGSIRDVLVENVRILSGKQPSARFDSFEGGRIYDIVVKDVYYGTERLDLKNTVGTNTEVSFEFSPPATAIARNSTTAGIPTASFAGMRNGQIYLNLKAGNYTVELYNLQGRMVGKTNINAIDGINSIGIRRDNLSRTIFILNVKQGDAMVLRHKIEMK